MKDKKVKNASNVVHASYELGNFQVQSDIIERDRNKTLQRRNRERDGSLESSKYWLSYDRPQKLLLPRFDLSMSCFRCKMQGGVFITLNCIQLKIGELLWSCADCD